MLKNVRVRQQFKHLIIRVSDGNLIMLSGKCLHGIQILPPRRQEEMLPVPLRFAADSCAFVSTIKSYLADSMQN